MTDKTISNIKLEVQFKGNSHKVLPMLKMRLNLKSQFSAKKYEREMTMLNSAIPQSSPSIHTKKDLKKLAPQRQQTILIQDHLQISLLKL
jgi:hypothetical protein